VIELTYGIDSPVDPVFDDQPFQASESEEENITVRAWGIRFSLRKNPRNLEAKKKSMIKQIIIGVIVHHKGYAPAYHIEQKQNLTQDDHSSSNTGEPAYRLLPLTEGPFDFGLFPERRIKLVLMFQRVTMRSRRDKLGRGKR
jgi:hypothetical protein